MQRLALALTLAATCACSLTTPLDHLAEGTGGADGADAGGGSAGESRDGGSAGHGGALAGGSSGEGGGAGVSGAGAAGASGAGAGSAGAGAASDGAASGGTAGDASAGAGGSLAGAGAGGSSSGGAGAGAAGGAAGAAGAGGGSCGVRQSVLRDAPEDVVNFGSTGVAWNGTSSVVQSDDGYATYQAGFPFVQFSRKLLATKLGFTIPATAVIDGVVVAWERYGAGIRDREVLIHFDDGRATNNHASLALWGSSEGYVSYGTPTDTWGTAITPTDAMSDKFGVSLQVESAGGSGMVPTANVDHVRVTIHFTVPCPDG